MTMLCGVLLPQAWNMDLVEIKDPVEAYESIHRTSTAFCSIADTDEQARVQIPDLFRDRMRGRALIGSPEMIRQRLGELEEAGVQELIMSFFPRTDLEQLRRFARECIV